MTRQEIIDFIQQNQGDRILDYYNKIYEKQKDLTKRIDKITIYLIIIVISYFLVSKTTTSAFQLGPFTMTDFSVIHKLAPLLFSFFLLQFCVISAHKAEILKTLKWINLLLYNQTLTEKDLDETHYNFFTRLVLPFSIWSEILKPSGEGLTIGCLGVVLLLPLVIFLFLPFYFEYITIRYLIDNYWHDLFAKASIVMSIWMTVYVFYFYLKLLPDSLKTAVKDNSLSK